MALLSSDVGTKCWNPSSVPVEALILPFTVSHKYLFLFTLGSTNGTVTCVTIAIAAAPEITMWIQHGECDWTK